MDYTKNERAYIGALELLAGMEFHKWYGQTGLISKFLVGEESLDKAVNDFLKQLE